MLHAQIEIMDKFTLDLKALTQTQIDITWCVGGLIIKANDAWDLPCMGPPRHEVSPP